MGAPLPVREFSSVAEMQAHYAAVRRRMDEGRAAPKASSLAEAVRAETPRSSRPWVAPQVFERLEIRTPGQLAGARCSATDCLRVAAAVTSLTQANICSERRTAVLVKARQIAFWLMVRIAERSLPDAGRRLGGRDHTTALHAVRKVEAAAAHLGLSLEGAPAEIAERLWSARWPRVEYQSLRAAR